MTNPYITYYQNQIGSGIPGFRGLRNQKGYGFLSSFLTKSVIPLLKPIIKTINPTSIFKSAKDALGGSGLSPGSTLADDIAKLGGEATGSLIKTLQKGSGRKYKRVKRTRLSSVQKRTSKRKQRGKRKTKGQTKRKVKKSKKSKSRKLSKINSIFL